MYGPTRHWIAFAISFLLCGPAAFADTLPDQPHTHDIAEPQQLASRTSELAMHAMGLLGINYKFGGNTPEQGLDCSGLVRYVYKEAWGEILPRTAEEMSRVDVKIRQQALQPGDLVFFNTLKRRYSHVGIYLGERRFIHSPSSGGQVRIESMDVNYWKRRFNGARRILDPEQKNATPSISVQANPTDLPHVIPY